MGSITLSRIDPIPNISESLVSGKFSSATSYASSALSTANSALSSLGSIRLDYFTPSLSDISVEAPNPGTPPVAPTRTVNAGSAPSLAGAPTSNISLPDIGSAPPVGGAPSAPSAPVSAPHVGAGSAGVLDDDIAAAAKIKILDWIQNGGTGLDPTVEQAIWDRAENRLKTEDEKLYSEAAGFWAARGWDMPQGAVNAAISEVQERIAMRQADLARDILVQSSNLAQNNAQFSITEGRGWQTWYGDVWLRKFAEMDLALQQVLISKYESDIAAARLAVETFSAEVQAYVAELDAEIRAYTAESDARVSSARIAVDAYAADVQAYAAESDAQVRSFSANVEAQVAQVRADAAVFEAEGRIYGATADVAARLFEAEVEAQKALVLAQVEAAGHEARVATAKAEISSANARGVAEVAAGLASSAMMSVNASASISHSESNAASNSYVATEQVSEDLMIQQWIGGVPI